MSVAGTIRKVQTEEKERRRTYGGICVHRDEKRRATRRRVGSLVLQIACGFYVMPFVGFWTDVMLEAEKDSERKSAKKESEECGP